MDRSTTSLSEIGMVQRFGQLAAISGLGVMVLECIGKHTFVFVFASLGGIEMLFIKVDGVYELGCGIPCSEISKNNKIKAENIADEVKKSDSGKQKCELHPPAISLPSSSYTTITPPPQSQTCSKMQNSGLDSIPSPNTPLPSMVMVSAYKPSQTPVFQLFLR
ncbi:hypothetical protein CWI37_2283p0010 [Hamiltosporidium tvaerminnensis]|uniref:Uncharacterized protein n=1 Tax=Hamiltosporidium tvaerminnensis TaxID=1176355 RepID=A0A4Q9KSF4_9MICR|nr:hypothetical protein CWI37_2283p0010 [Hamiltosporidium tvaerminnensis]